MACPPLGTKVVVNGLKGRADLNGRHGTVCGVLDEESGRVPVKVMLAKPSESESVRIKLANLQPGVPEPRFQVVRTQCTMTNTGTRGGLSAQIGTIFTSRGDANSPLVVEERSSSELAALISERRWVEHPTDLCERFGLSVLCYAQRYRRSDEHQGKNNIIATFLTCHGQTGLAPDTVLGEAIFVRLSPTTREPVDFVLSEATRALCYVNDLMDVYPIEESCGRTPADKVAYFETIRLCYPYYMANGEEDDNMRARGFYGGADGERECRRMTDGSLRKKPADLQPDAEFIKIE